MASDTKVCANNNKDSVQQFKNNKGIMTKCERCGELREKP